jgi:ABC-type nickel/cobalt efflux system permease component RcnA
MRKLACANLLRQLPRMLLVSFGTALCVLMVATIASMVLTSGERTFGADEGRLAFTISFAVSFLTYAVVVLLRATRA